MDRFDILEGHYAFYYDFHNGTQSDYYKRLKKLIKFYNPGDQFQGYDDLSEDGVKVYHRLEISHYERKLRELPEYSNYPVSIESIFETLLIKTYWNPVKVVEEDCVFVRLRLLVKDFPNKTHDWNLLVGDIENFTSQEGFWGHNIVFKEHKACDLIRVAYELAEEALVSAMI